MATITSSDLDHLEIENQPQDWLHNFLYYRRARKCHIARAELNWPLEVDERFPPSGMHLVILSLNDGDGRQAFYMRNEHTDKIIKWTADALRTTSGGWAIDVWEVTGTNEHDEWVYKSYKFVAGGSL